MIFIIIWIFLLYLVGFRVQKKCKLKVSYFQKFYTFDITHHGLTFFYKGKIKYFCECFNIKLILFIFLFLFCVTILPSGVFLNLIKPDEVGKPIANETSLQFWHYEEFSSLYFTLIDRKPASFIINQIQFGYWIDFHSKTCSEQSKFM